MDLEFVGRHALLFDDDAMASFVNSNEALVEWNSLYIDRYDVRHLLSAPPPPRNRRRQQSPMPPLDSDLVAEIEHERYLDLPSPSDQQDLDSGENLENSGGYHFVPFSYGNPIESTAEKSDDAECGFRPSFYIPEDLLQHIPPTDKLHQIISRTAMFVSKHGGQSEIVLRVKQGDNPTFGFLMPDHRLHPYFRFLVDHQELLKSDGDGTSLEEENKAGGGALSLLGSVYGSGEDEDGQTEDASELKRDASEGAVDTVSVTAAHEPEQRESSSMDVAGKDEAVLKHHLPLKDKAHFIKRNRSISAVKAGSTSVMKKEGDTVGLHLSAPAADNIHASGSPLKVDLHILEPPSDMKRVVDKIVEFIMKNGREFEAILVQQDIKHGRFPFLLSSNQYHPYYLKVLQNAQESRLPGKVSEKHESVRHGAEKKTAMMKENDALFTGSDIPYDSDRKEKFKMVIGKSKKDGQDSPSKATQPAQGVSVDAAAAILRAARKGTKYPDFGILSKNALNGISQGPSSEGVEVSVQKLGQDGESSVSVPVAKAIAKTVAVAAAGEADSSEATLTKEQKLKAERLKRAKMFAAMIKSGASTSKSEQLRGLSAEPLESGTSGSLADVLNFAGKEREASTVPLDVDMFEKDTIHYNERRSKRSYRSRSKIHDEEEEGETKEDKREEEEEKGERDCKRSGKKRRSHGSSHHSRDRHKHRKRHSSKDRSSRHRHKHDSSSDDELHHSRRHKRYSSSGDEDRYSQHHREHDSSSEDEHWRSKHHHKRTSSSGDEDQKQSGSITKNRKKSKHEREVELEEGEIYIKSDQSKASEGANASREASVDMSRSYEDARRTPSQPSGTTEPSDELRAKIRAMLMATL